MVSVQEVAVYMEKQRSIENVQKSAHPADLCKYTSQRKMTIPYLSLNGVFDIVYLGYYFLINVIGFNPALNSFIIVCA